MHSANAILARTQFESGPKIVNSFLSDIYFTRCTLHQLLLERLESERSAPQKIFDQQTLQSFTYSELAQLIRKTATAFSEQFLLPGDYVIYIGSNCLEYLSLYFGALCVGAIPISIPKANVSLQDIKTKIIQHNIQYLVISAEVDSLWVKKLLNSVSTILKVIIYNQETKNPFNNPLHSDEDDVLTLMKNPKLVTYFDFIQNANIAPIADEDLYQPKNVTTSLCLAVNSSGNGEWPPKILLYGHYGIVGAIEVLCHSSVLDYRSIDKLLAYGPFEHLENVLMFLAGIFLSCNVILLPTFNFELVTQTIQDHRINLAWLSSNIILKLLKVQSRDTTKPNLLGCLTKVVTFGGKIPAASCTDFFLRFPRVKSLRHCYLLSESPIPISMMVRNSHDYDSVGYVMPNTRVKILQDPTNADSMNEANKAGFVCIEREPELFAIGYLNQHSQHILPLIFETTDGDSVTVINQIVVKPANTTLPNRRWFKTDDIGYYDEDGLLYVYGKWFNTLGIFTGIRARIQENEIETILLSHPAIEEVSLILKRDQSWAAAVVAKEFSTTELPKLSGELGAYLNSKMSTITVLNQSHASVSNIFIKHSLPKTSSGRVVRCLIRDEVQNLLNIKRKF